MSFLTRRLKQDIVYWGNPTPSGFGGDEFDAYVAIKGRWEDTQKKFIDAQGDEVVSKAVVYLAQDVDINGWLFLGDLTDISSARQDNPELVSGAWQIRGMNKTPNLKGTEWEREVFL